MLLVVKLWGFILGLVAWVYILIYEISLWIHDAHLIAAVLIDHPVPSTAVVWTAQYYMSGPKALWMNPPGIGVYNCSVGALAMSEVHKVHTEYGRDGKVPRFLVRIGIA